MIGHARVLVAGASLLALALGILAAGSGSAADDNTEKAARAALRKVADLVEKGEMAGAKAAAKDIAKKYELEEVMHAFQLRTKKGEGIGDKPGEFRPDGIEAALVNWARKPPTQKELEKKGDAIARAAYISAATAEVAKFKVPDKDPKDAKKNPKDWEAWSKDMTDASLELAKAAKAKDPKALKEAASKLNTTCNNCHGVFRD
jgi:hypothetical protein